jgi:hypothetical protein
MFIEAGVFQKILSSVRSGMYDPMTKDRSPELHRKGWVKR